MRIFKKRDRRKDHATRRLIEANEAAVTEVREDIKELIATINGDPDWLCKRLLKKEEKKIGHNGSAISDNCH